MPEPLFLFYQHRSIPVCRYALFHGAPLRCGAIADIGAGVCLAARAASFGRSAKPALANKKASRCMAFIILLYLRNFATLCEGISKTSEKLKQI